MVVGARLEGIQLSGIRKMFELTTEKSINLGLGEPDFQPAEHIRQALMDAVNNGYNKYGPTGGIPELREVLAKNAQKYRDDITANDIVVTTGSTQALEIIAQYLFELGDDVGMKTEPLSDDDLFEEEEIPADAEPSDADLVIGDEEEELLGDDDDVSTLRTPVKRAKAAVEEEEAENPALLGVMVVTAIVLLLSVLVVVDIATSEPSPMVEWLVGIFKP